MKPNKKLLASGVAVAALALVTVSFQNCSGGSTSDSSSTVSTTATDGLSTSTITYPSTSSPIVLTTGQNISLKIAKPSSLSDLSGYIWVAYGARSALVAAQGSITENGSYWYANIAVRGDLTTRQDYRILLYNYTTKLYLDGNGVIISLRPSVSNPYSSDYVTDVCNLRVNYVPSFSINRSAAVASALTVMENGAGVGSLTCSLSGTYFDCLTPSAWPSGWTSSNITITGYNRCGKYSTATY